MKFETHCPEGPNKGNKCTANTTGCAVGQCMLRNVGVAATQQADIYCHKLYQYATQLWDMKKSMRNLVAVLTEPGIMDADQWKAWSRQVVIEAKDVLGTLDGMKFRQGDSYRCRDCGTLWFMHGDYSWSLVNAGKAAGKCCDNSPDFLSKLVPLVPSDGSEQFTIFVDGKPIDVAAIYKAKGFDKLPPTVTLTGGEIRKAYGRTPSYTLARGRYPACVEIADGVAVTLVNGEHFYVLLPASMW